jgi:hypothetical protein
MKIFTIKNWQNYQHYKDRNPPWIKLHYEMITSKDWVKFDDASKLLAIVCMMIASRNEGQIEDDCEYIQSVAHLRKKPNLQALINSGFLVLTSETLADASTMQADAIIEERHIEQTETYKIEDYISVFNEVLNKQSRMVDARKKLIANFAKSFSVDEFKQAMQKVKASNYLNSVWTNWGFDWFMNEKNFIKVIEGNYDNKGKLVVNAKHKDFAEQDYYKNTGGLNVI